MPRGTLSAPRGTNAAPRGTLLVARQTLTAPRGSLVAATSSLAGTISGTASCSGTLQIHGSNAPSSLVASAIAPLEVRLTWSHANAPTDTRYQIERSDGASGWYRIGTAHAGYNRYDDWGRQPNTSYTYRLRAVNSGGTSSYTNQATATTLNTSQVEEFVGPLSGWRNVKTDYGAAGNGTTDDTTAFQNAFTDLDAHVMRVLYVPAGTYKITSTIATNFNAPYGAGQPSIGIAVIGEDPATTTIAWYGASGGRMIQWNAWYSRFARLTLDGRSLAQQALYYGHQFTTYNETSDCVFKDCAVGIKAGYSADELGQPYPESEGQAENFCHRNKFVRCTQKGLHINQANSLDWWLWHNEFDTCGYGIDHLRGNFFAYRNYFHGSTLADIHGGGPEFFGIFDNVSIDSNTFADFPTGPVTVAGNRVIRPANGLAINFLYTAPRMVLDNLCRAANGVTTPQIQMGQYSHLFVGNLYNVAQGTATYDFAGQSIDRQVDEETSLATAGFDPTAPALPTPPPKVTRTVFEVAAGASTATIQAALTNAANAAGTKPVVHLAFGSYNVTSTLTIPANCDLTLVGDGTNQSTHLNWTGGGTGPMLQITGPSSVRVTEIEFDCPGAHGIYLLNVDQAGSQIVCSDLQLNGYSAQGVAAHRLENLENTDVWMLSSQGTGFTYYFHVTGSTTQNTGAVTSNRLGAFSGAVGDNANFYTVTNGARFVSRGIYNEIATPGNPTVLTMTGHGYLAIDAPKLGYVFQSSPPAFDLNGMMGELLVMGGKLVPGGTTTTFARISVHGDGTNTRALWAGMSYDIDITGLTSDTAYQDTSNPPATSGFLLPVTDSGGQQTTLPDRGTITDTHIRAMLRLLRSTPRGCLLQPASAGKTSIALHRFRVAAGTGKDALKISA